MEITIRLNSSEDGWDKVYRIANALRQATETTPVVTAKEATKSVPGDQQPEKGPVPATTGLAIVAGALDNQPQGTLTTGTFDDPPTPDTDNRPKAKREPKLTAKQRAAMAPPVAPAAPAEPAEMAVIADTPTYTEADIAKIVTDYRDQVGGGSTAGLVTKLKAKGVKRVTELAKDVIPTFLKELQDEIAAKGAK